VLGGGADRRAGHGRHRRFRHDDHHDRHDRHSLYVTNPGCELVVKITGA
jgi:hypothetical protein